ncbi:zf-CCHC domain-containing protein [Tanacetum coccineum]
MNNLLSLKKILLIADFLDLTQLLLKALDEGFPSKNYVRKFLRALHPKWRVKVTKIEESKYLSSLALDELIAKKESSDDETSTFKSDDKEYDMAKSFWKRDEKKGKSDQKCFRCGNPNHLIGECPKPPQNKDQKVWVGVSWSGIKNEDEEKTDNETFLMAQSSNEVTLDSSFFSDNASSLDDDAMQNEYNNLYAISLKYINKNKILKTKRELLENKILELKEKLRDLRETKLLTLNVSHVKNFV